MNDLYTPYSKLNPKDRKRIAQKLLKRMRKDVGWLIKPRPRMIPFNLWLWVLTSVLYLDNNSLKDICLISSSKPNKTNNGKTL